MKSNHPIALTLAEIAERLGGRLNGPPDLTIRGVGSIDGCGPGEITFLENPRYLSKLRDCRAEAIVLAHDLELDRDLPNIRVDQPQIAFADLLEIFRPRRRESIGVSVRAHVAEDARIGKGSNVYPGATIGAGASVGDDTDIYPGVYVGPRVRIGSGCTLYPNAVIYEDCELGDRVILHSGVVIGGDGYGYVQQKQADPQEPIIHRKVPQVGRVVIEDDVEIGANSTVDRGSIDTTRIKRGAKIDNLVMIAHNCQLGRHSLIVAQAGISGSTRIGEYTTLGGQVGVGGHLKIGDRVQVGAQAGVTHSLPDEATVWGTPAIEIGKARRAYVALERLPELRRQMRELQRRLDALEDDEPG